MVYGLMNQPPSRPPFSDWKAQVERMVERATGRRFIGNVALRSCYDVGLSPRKIADDIIGDRR